MHLMLSKTVLWQLSLHAIRMFFPQLKLGEINWIPGESCFGVHILGIYVACVLLGVKVLQPWNTSRLSGGIWPFGGRLGLTTAMRVESRTRGKRSEVSKQPWRGVETLGLMLLYRPQGQFCDIRHCALKYRDGSRAGVRRCDTIVELFWLRSVHDKDCLRGLLN